MFANLSVDSKYLATKESATGPAPTTRTVFAAAMQVISDGRMNAIDFMENKGDFMKRHRRQVCVQVTFGKLFK